MKQIILTLITFVLAPLCLFSQENEQYLSAPYLSAPDKAELSLLDCQRLALENSEKLTIADIQTLIQDDKLSEVWGIVYPQISAEGQYVAAGEARQFLRKHKTANAKASLIVPLWNFGGYSNAIDAQEKLYESSLYDYDRVRQEVLYAVSQSYFRLLEAQKIHAIVQESLRLLKSQKKITDDFFEQGLVQKNEALLVDVQIAQRQQDLLQAQNNISLAKAKLNRLIGAEIEQDTQVRDTLEEIAWNDDLQLLLCDAKACHPELLSLQAKIKAVRHGYKAERGALFPSVYFFSNYSTTNDYNFPYTHGLDAGFGVQMSLYDGGQTYARMRIKKKECAELQYRYKALEEDIELKVRSSYMNVETAANKVPVALKGIKLAEENLRITREQYEEGLVATFDVLNDEERLAQARSNYFQALYDFHKARSDLLYSAGMNVSDAGS